MLFSLSRKWTNSSCVSLLLLQDERHTAIKVVAPELSWQFTFIWLPIKTWASKNYPSVIAMHNLSSGVLTPFRVLIMFLLRVSKFWCQWHIAEKWIWFTCLLRYILLYLRITLVLLTPFAVTTPCLAFKWKYNCFEYWKQNMPYLLIMY